MTILNDIIRYKKNIELPKQKEAVSLATVRAQAVLADAVPDFLSALKNAPGVALIAEVKKASPSKGVIRPQFDAVELARAYAENGAAAISVLTDANYFQGRLDFIPQISGALKKAGLPRPLLRKDFIFDPYQIYEARAAGASAVLLIAAVLQDAALESLFRLARKLGLTVLLEVHNRAELERVLPLRPRLIGVNNRDLRDFSVDLNTGIELRPHIPAETVMVAESGIRTRADVERLAAAGIDAILVGEAIVRQKNVGKKVRELLGGK